MSNRKPSFLAPVEKPPIIENEINKQPRVVYRAITPENRIVPTSSPSNQQQLVAYNSNGEPIDPNRIVPIDTLGFNRDNPPLGVKQKRRIIIHHNPSSPSNLNNPRKSVIIVKKPSELKNIKEDDNVSNVTEASSDFYPSNSLKITKKLLSGFHPYHDEEADVMALQCSTCCIGCWRNCSHRCTGCENFISCPIYCWIGVLLPLIVLLFIGFIISIVYAAGKFS